MTNREKYINNASNEELANTLERGFYQIRTKINISKGYFDVKKYILEWLSQEAEEDIVNIPSIGKMLKTDKTKIIFDYEKPEIIQLTKKAYYSILVRLDNLEKCNRIAEVEEYIKESLKEKTKDIVKNKNIHPMTKEDAEELVNKIGLCAEEVKQMNKTADEMFEELGFWKVRDDIIGKTHTIIYTIRGGDTGIEVIRRDDKCFYMKRTNAVNQEISLKEDKAIHKKIEELKNESREVDK